MAVIPTTNGPRVAPGRVQMNRPGVEAGVAVGRALENLGRVGAQIALDSMVAQRTLDDRQRDDAERSAGLLALESGKLTLRTEMRRISDGVVAGQLSEKDATDEWASVRSRVLDQHGKELAPDLKRQVTTQLQVRAEDLAGNELPMAIKTRQRDVTRANVLSTMELYERDAIENRPRAVAITGEMLRALGPAAGLGPDDQFKTLQGFKERTAFNLGERLVLHAGRDLSALEGLNGRINTDEFADLSPEKRQALEVKIANRRASVLHEQDVLQRRAEALQERRLREAEHATKAVQGIIDGGALPDDATLAEVQRKTSGTIWAKTVKALVNDGAERAAFGSLSPEQQQEQLIGLRSKINQAGASPAQLERMRKFEGIASKTREAVDKDPLQWGVQSRLIQTPAELHFDSLQGLAQSLGARVEQAQLVSAQLRRPVSPLFAYEAQRASEMLSGLPLDQKQGAVRMLARALPPEQQRALAGQVHEQDNVLALAMHAASLPQGKGADVVGLMLRGQDAVKAGRIKKSSDDGVVAMDRAKMAQELNKVSWPTTKARDAAVQAAWLIYDGQRDAKGSGSRRDAVNLATGGGLVEWGDSMVPMPPGWTESRFKSSMRTLAPAALGRQAGGPLYIGGAEVSPEALVRALPSATLMPVGPGTYAIDSGGMVVDAKRRPFIFKLED